MAHYAYLDRVLAADETEVASQFDEKVFEFGKQTPMQIGLQVPVGQLKELDDIGVFEDLVCIGVGLSQRSCDFWRREDGALEKAGVELTLKLAAGPLLTATTGLSARLCAQGVTSCQDTTR